MERNGGMRKSVCGKETKSKKIRKEASRKKSAEALRSPACYFAVSVLRELRGTWFYSTTPKRRDFRLWRSSQLPLPS